MIVVTLVIKGESCGSLGEVEFVLVVYFERFRREGDFEKVFEIGLEVGLEF